MLHSLGKFQVPSHLPHLDAPCPDTWFKKMYSLKQHDCDCNLSTWSLWGLHFLTVIPVQTLLSPEPSCQDKRG
jgi:hypothetical protein